MERSRYNILLFRFDDTRLEHDYRMDYVSKLRPQVYFALSAAAVLWLSFALLDGFNTPELSSFFWAIRGFIIFMSITMDTSLTKNF